MDYAAGVKQGTTVFEGTVECFGADDSNELN
jgi:hypothetical protein